MIGSYEVQQVQIPYEMPWNYYQFPYGYPYEGYGPQHFQFNNYRHLEDREAVEAVSDSGSTEDMSFNSLEASGELLVEDSIKMHVIRDDLGRPTHTLNRYWEVMKWGYKESEESGIHEEMMRAFKVCIGINIVGLKY
jgi:hypothetical protein